MNYTYQELYQACLKTTQQMGKKDIKQMSWFFSNHSQQKGE